MVQRSVPEKERGWIHRFACSATPSHCTHSVGVSMPASLAFESRSSLDRRLCFAVCAFCCVVCSAAGFLLQVTGRTPGKGLHTAGTYGLKLLCKWGSRVCAVHATFLSLLQVASAQWA